MRSRLTFAVAVALSVALALPGIAAARVVRAETVLPMGESGFVPQSGSNPAIADQVNLFQTFAYKPAGFDEPAASTESPRPGVTITRDAWGVPDVRAGNDRDAWFGVGYAVAQDRLTQLEFFRRGTKGTLAAVLGTGYLQQDIVARRDYYTDSELRRMIKQLPSALRARLKAYAEGVNAWIARTNADPSLQPAEIALLHLHLAPWTPMDSIRIGVQLARTIPSGDGAELANWTALRKLGARRFSSLLPLRRSSQVASVPASAGRFPSDPGRTSRDERAGLKQSVAFLRKIKPPSASVSAVAAARPGGVHPVHGGSDTWAVRGANHTAYLFNGPELGFTVPEQLYEFEVHRPGLDARGVTPPGLPLVGIGRNAHIAWGLTSGLSDTNDLYAEHLVGHNRYLFKGKVRKMSCRRATFQVSGKPDAHVQLCRTVHGPVQARLGKHTAYARRYAAWKQEMGTLVGLDRLDVASSVKQAGKAISKVTWNENTMVADDKGHIGWWHPGLLPIRPKRWDERLPYPGTGQAEWRGFLRFKQVPHVIDPKRGWIANWNNPPSVAWTNGDDESRERNTGRLHRAAYLFRLVAAAAKNPSFDSVLGVDRLAGSVAQQRPLLTGLLRKADRGATGGAKTVLDTILAWDGSYDRVDANGTVDPGVAAFGQFLAAIGKRTFSPAARTLLGTSGSSHQFDADPYASVALLTAKPAAVRAAAGSAAKALAAQFGSASPAAWRVPRPLYDVNVIGVAPKPRLEFFDRGTWQQMVQLGP